LPYWAENSSVGLYYGIVIQENLMINKEAKIWNSVCLRTEKVVGIERGSTRVTVIIQTLLVVFQVDEI